MSKALRIFVVLLAVGFGVWGFSYTYRWYFRFSEDDRNLTTLTAEELAAYPSEKRLEIKEMKKLRARIINLGLDLQGGMYLVLEPDYDELARRSGSVTLAPTMYCSELPFHRVLMSSASKPTVPFSCTLG